MRMHVRHSRSRLLAKGAFTTRPFVICELLLLANVSVLAAQAPQERRLIDSLFREIGKAEVTAALPANARCANQNGSLERLCEGLISAKRAELTRAAVDADKAEQLLSRTVLEHPTWPMAWYGLGIARLQMGRANMTSREGPLSPTGLSLEAGAANALIRALEIDSTFQEALEALALAPLPREGASRLNDRVVMLERLQRGLPGSARYAAGMLELEVNRPDKAVAFFETALTQTGIDSGVVLLALARARYGSGDAELGRVALLGGAADTSSLSSVAYRHEIAWVASPTELLQWDSLPAQARADWLRAFWSRRDVEDGRPDNSRLIEHYRRMEVALDAYKLVLPRNGRNKAAGQSGTVDFQAEEMIQRHPEDFPLANIDPSIAVMAVTASVIGARSPFHAFRTSQAVLDDRGAAYIRHGKPDEVATTKMGLALELWKYERPGGPILLGFTEEDFDGQVGASKLVPSLLSASPQLRDQLCQLDTRLCSTNADPTAPRIVFGAMPNNAANRLSTQNGVALSVDQSRNGVSQLQVANRRGAEVINEAMTTDDNLRKFTRKVDPRVQIYGLDRASGGEPRLVVSFAIPGEELSSDSPPSAMGRAIYPVDFHLMATRQSDGKLVELDTLRQFAVAHVLSVGEFITGMIEMKVPAGTYSASLLVTQADGRGAVVALSGVVTPRAEAVLQVSDIVLGREGSAVRWNSGSSLVPLNPLNAYSKGGAAEVYYQVSGLTVGTLYDTKFEFYKAGELDKPAKLRLAFKETPQQARGEITRTLGLANLDPGQYQIRLVVSGGGHQATALSWLTVAAK